MLADRIYMNLTPIKWKNQLIYKNIDIVVTHKYTNTLVILFIDKINCIKC